MGPAGMFGRFVSSAGDSLLPFSSPSRLRGPRGMLFVPVMAPLFRQAMVDGNNEEGWFCLSEVATNEDGMEVQKTEFTKLIINRAGNYKSYYVEINVTSDPREERRHLQFNFPGKCGSSKLTKVVVKLSESISSKLAAIYLTYNPNMYKKDTNKSKSHDKIHTFPPSNPRPRHRSIDYISVIHEASREADECVYYTIQREQGSLRK
jgi:hypothetical protein